MALVWVTGSAGVGKSTACALLRRRGEWAVDADLVGFNRWVDRTTGEVADPPYPTPAGWLKRFGWEISRPEVEELTKRARGKTAFLCGSVENEVEIRDLFSLVICLVVDDETLSHRLKTRSTNAFGKQPEELAAALKWNARNESDYRRRGATIIDGTRPPEEIADAILSSAREKLCL